MKKLIPYLASLFVIASLASCGKPTHDSLTDDMIGQMEELAAVLESVEDVDSANKAKPKLEKIGAKMEEIKKSMDEIGDPTSEVEEELKKKYEERMKTALGDVMGAMMKLATKPEANKIVSEAMDDIGKSMK